MSIMGMLLSAFPISKASHYCSSPLPSLPPHPHPPLWMHAQASVLTVPLRRPNGQKKGKGPLPKTRMYYLLHLLCLFGCVHFSVYCLFLLFVLFCFFWVVFVFPSFEWMSHFDWPIPKKTLLEQVDIPTIKSFFFICNFCKPKDDEFWLRTILRKSFVLFLVIHKSLTLAFFLSFSN